MLSRFCAVCDKPFGLEGPYAESSYKKKNHPVCCPKCLEEFEKNSSEYVAGRANRGGGGFKRHS